MQAVDGIMVKFNVVLFSIVFRQPVINFDERNVNVDKSNKNQATSKQQNSNVWNWFSQNKILNTLKVF